MIILVYPFAILFLSVSYPFTIPSFFQPFLSVFYPLRIRLQSYPFSILLLTFLCFQLLYSTAHLHIFWILFLHPSPSPRYILYTTSKYLFLPTDITPTNRHARPTDVHEEYSKVIIPENIIPYDTAALFKDSTHVDKPQIKRER